jgi:hypothetical protein
MSRILLGLTCAVAVAAFAGQALAGSGGVTGPAFYVDGDLYRTVNTPTDLSGTGAPAHSFDTIYDLGGAQPNVATAAPGDPGYNGGRWMVHALAFNTSTATKRSPRRWPTRARAARGTSASSSGSSAR